jgi:hypothetical protein
MSVAEVDEFYGRRIRGPRERREGQAKKSGAPGKHQ